MTDHGVRRDLVDELTLSSEDRRNLESRVTASRQVETEGVATRTSATTADMFRTAPLPSPPLELLGGEWQLWKHEPNLAISPTTSGLSPVSAAWLYLRSADVTAVRELVAPPVGERVTLRLTLAAERREAPYTKVGPAAARVIAGDFAVTITVHVADPADRNRLVGDPSVLGAVVSDLRFTSRNTRR